MHHSLDAYEGCSVLISVTWINFMAKAVE